MKYSNQYNVQNCCRKEKCIFSIVRDYLVKPLGIVMSIKGVETSHTDLFLEKHLQSAITKENNSKTQKVPEIWLDFIFENCLNNYCDVSSLFSDCSRKYKSENIQLETFILH